MSFRAWELQSHRSVKSWSKESRESAVHDAYLDGTLPPGENAAHATILPTGYTRHAKEIAERRVALAGYLTVQSVSPTRREVEGVLDNLKAVEKRLNKNEAAFLRAQFLSYFAQYQ